MEKITDELTGVKTVAIAGHIRPDGDCIGSCMGMYLYLKENYPDIETDIYLEQPREGFSYISHLEDIKTAHYRSEAHSRHYRLFNHCVLSGR